MPSLPSIKLSLMLCLTCVGLIASCAHAQANQPAINLLIEKNCAEPLQALFDTWQEQEEVDIHYQPLTPLNEAIYNPFVAYAKLTSNPISKAKLASQLKPVLQACSATEEDYLEKQQQHQLNNFEAHEKTLGFLMSKSCYDSFTRYFERPLRHTNLDVYYYIAPINQPSLFPHFDYYVELTTTAPDDFHLYSAAEDITASCKLRSIFGLSTEHPYTHSFKYYFDRININLDQTSLVLTAGENPPTDSLSVWVRPEDVPSMWRKQP